jgi:hypothetical protein
MLIYQQLYYICLTLVYQPLLQDGNGISRSIMGKIQAGDYNKLSKFDNLRKFAASLPEGTYTSKFINEDGTEIWPTFVLEMWEATPDCPMSAGPLDIKLSKPQISSSHCEEMIRNGGQDAILTTSEP